MRQPPSFRSTYPTVFEGQLATMRQNRRTIVWAGRAGMGVDGEFRSVPIGHNPWRLEMQSPSAREDCLSRSAPVPVPGPLKLRFLS